MSKSLENKLRDMQQELIMLRRRMEQRPVISPSSAAVNYYTITVTGGNTLETGQTGILYEDSEITEVPSAYDPNVTSTFIDGIGRGVLSKNGTVQSGYVLICLDTRSVFPNALKQSDIVAAFGKLSIPVNGGGNVTAWLVG